jgi:hypothetical protein
MSNEVWRKETERCIVTIVSTFNWKGGIPIDPSIPKWLVKIHDKFLHDEYVPMDNEFKFLISTLDEGSLSVIYEAFKIKEKHNKANLKNPEDRKIERVFGKYKPKKKVIK